MSNAGPGCIVCTRTWILRDICLDDREEGVLGLVP